MIVYFILVESKRIKNMADHASLITKDIGHAVSYKEFN
jgi:hypothetical protein